MDTERRRQRAITAEHKAAYYLNKANEAQERGKREAEARYLERSQEWLDKANELRGWS